MRDALYRDGQAFLDLATNTKGEYIYKHTDSFSQEVTCISAQKHLTFVDDDGELKYHYYNLRFNFSKDWAAIIMISLVIIEGYSTDIFPGERGQHIYKKTNNQEAIIQLLENDGYIVDRERIFKKNMNDNT